MEVRYWGVRLHNRGLRYLSPCEERRLRDCTGKEAGELMWLYLRLGLWLLLLKLNRLRE